MNASPPARIPNISGERAVERLTALWALVEVGMGGFVHALKIPFTGIVVGSAAVILISAIGFFAERKAASIFRATMVVVLVKAAASPHSPLPAHLAVLFQGLVGAVLFEFVPWPRIAAVFLALLAFWEGAAQKLLVMTLIYGRPLWESVDLVGRRILERLSDNPSPFSPTTWFLILYTAYYTIGGIVTGWLAATLPHEIARAAAALPPTEAPPTAPADWREDRARKPWWCRTPVKAGLAAFVLVGLLMAFSPSGQGLDRGLRLLLRATIAIALWFMVVRPAAKGLFRWFQRREQSRYAADVSRVMNLMPSLRAVAAAAWSRAAHLSGWRRWKCFFVDLAARSLAE